MSPLSPIVDRDQLMVLRNLERPFVDRWIKSGEGAIPQMPHLPSIGRGVRFHLPSVDGWLLEHFQVGGVKR